LAPRKKRKEGGDWILGQETKIPHAVRCSQNKAKLLLRKI